MTISTAATLPYAGAASMVTRAGEHTVAFRELHYHRADTPSPVAREHRLRQFQPPRSGLPFAQLLTALPAEGGGPGFDSEEAACRSWLASLFASGDRRRSGARRELGPGLLAMRPEAMSDLRLRERRASPLTNTRIVTFDQTRESIPVFGAGATVEHDGKEVVSAHARAAEIQGLSSRPEVNGVRARRALGAYLQVAARQLQRVKPPELQFFLTPETSTWHLTWHFKRVPAAPPRTVKRCKRTTTDCHGIGPSPRQHYFCFDYLVDAHDGRVLYEYSVTPLLDVPSECEGLDELGKKHKFYARKRANGFEMWDSTRAIRTYDMGGRAWGSPLPKRPVKSATYTWGPKRMAAVSAHVNACRVWDFYNGILKRKGIDDRGMALVSVVNCAYENAFWWNPRDTGRSAIPPAMWYGSRRNGSESHSYARYLDVIAHELTHGITETTSELVYRDEPGALNESFSDIFGVIIKNWYGARNRNDVATWDWEMGAGLGDSSRSPLRDLSNPARTGDPAHMRDFRRTRDDEGGVHTNSNIHNKAAYLVLTARDEKGRRVFTVREVATLYYLTLTRLGSMGTFRDALLMLLDVTKTMVQNPTVMDRKLAAIEKAYRSVGITLGPTTPSSRAPRP